MDVFQGHPLYITVANVSNVAVSLPRQQKAEEGSSVPHEIVHIK